VSEHYKPLESGEGIGSYASKVAAAGLGPLPNPRLVVEYHPLVREALAPWHPSEVHTCSFLDPHYQLRLISCIPVLIACYR
jgi:hypothetical protein